MVPEVVDPLGHLFPCHSHPLFVPSTHFSCIDGLRDDPCTLSPEQFGEDLVLMIGDKFIGELGKVCSFIHKHKMKFQKMVCGFLKRYNFLENIK